MVLPHYALKIRHFTEITRRNLNSAVCAGWNAVTNSTKYSTN